MQNRFAKTQQLYAAIGAVLGWLAIVGQLYISITVKTVSLGELLLRFTGYFTITTNTLVALCFTCFWLPVHTRMGQWFRKPFTVFALAVFIAVVGIVYNLLLRFLWQPTGFQLVVDELLHSVQPIAFLLFWILFIPKNALRLKQFFPWLVYPLLYILYVLVLGACTGHYPYPFADVTQLGYARALLNAAGMLVGFVLLAGLLLGIVRLLSRSAP